MRKLFLSFLIPSIIAGAILISCKKEIDKTLKQESVSASTSTNSNTNEKSKRVYVSNVAELYTAVNNDDNAGVTIVLAPGTYMLNAAYPNGGRLELLHDMSLTGQPANPEQVIIDASNLPASSFRVLRPGETNTVQTGAVRMGDGENGLEWMTLQNNPSHNMPGFIFTDIIATPVTQIRVAHSIIKGGERGICLINNRIVANGRTIKAEIEDNDILDNTILEQGVGVQIRNVGGSDATILATLRRNHIYGNRVGILAFNASTRHCAVEVKSYDDIIENNGAGIQLIGGLLFNGPVLHNSVKFDAYGSTIKNNNGSPSPGFGSPPCGLYAQGAECLPPNGPLGEAHHNRLDISFHGCVIEDNAGSAQIIGFGGNSTYPLPTPVGTYNIANIYLTGRSANVSVNAVNSVPVEPAGTNTVSVLRSN